MAVHRGTESPEVDAPDTNGAARPSPYGHGHLHQETFGHELPPVEAPPVGEPKPPPRRLLGFVIFGIAFGAYFAIGYSSVIGAHVVVFDALDRLTRAYLIWHDDPAKLAAVGFSFPPLTTLSFIPLALIKPIATSLVAMPLTSAFFAAVAIILLDRTFARCTMPPLARYPLLLAFGLNPMFVFYASNGMGEAIYLAGLALTLYSMMGWFTTREPRYLVAGGIGLITLTLTRYSFGIWALVIAFAVSVAARRGPRGESEGTAVTLLTPMVYGLALWIFFNATIAGDAFGWLTSGAGPAVNAPNSAAASVSLSSAIGHCIEATAGIMPLSIPVFVGLIVAFFARRSQFAFWLAFMLLLSLAIVGVDAYSQGQAGDLALRNFMPVVVVTAVGLAWLYRSFDGLRALIWAAGLVGMLLTVPIALHTMNTYPYQNLEQAFARSVEHRTSQEGTSSIGGFLVGIDSERQMAAYIDNNVTKRHSVLTDNAHTFGVILLSGKPQLFFDRVQHGDAVFKSVLADPYGRVQYLLIAKNSPDDLINIAYPNADKVPPPGMVKAFETDRYLLLQVPNKAPQPPSNPATATITPSTGTTTTPGTTTGTTTRGTTTTQGTTTTPGTTTAPASP